MRIALVFHGRLSRELFKSDMSALSKKRRRAGALQKGVLARGIRLECGNPAAAGPLLKRQKSREMSQFNRDGSHSARLSSFRPGFQCAGLAVTNRMQLRTVREGPSHCRST
jgi:hypothetical protein